MSTIVVKSGGALGLAAWREAFAEIAPEHTLVSWDADVSTEAVDFALVWEPEPGRLAAFPNLRAVISTGAGVDHILRDPDWPRSVPLYRMGGQETEDQMADYVLWGCLGLLHGAWRWQAAKAARTWMNPRPRRAPSDVCVGIMGLGQLGMATARKLMTAGFPVAAWSRTSHDVPGLTCFSGEADRAAFLAQTDILVCLLPATEQTRGILNMVTFRGLRPGASVINVGRGAHLVEADLLAALNDHTLDACLLDVFTTEPLPETSSLWTHPRIMVTPHVAAEASYQARARHAVDVINAVLAGREGKLRYVPERGY